MILSKELASFWKIATLFIVSKMAMISPFMLVYFKLWSSLLRHDPSILLYELIWLLFCAFASISWSGNLWIASNHRKSIKKTTHKSNKSKNILGLVHQSGKLWRQVKCSHSIHKRSTSPASPPVLTAAPGLSLMEIFDFTFTVTLSCIFIIYTLSTKVDVLHILLSIFTWVNHRHVSFALGFVYK